MQLILKAYLQITLPHSHKMISSQAIKEEEFQEFFKLADAEYFDSCMSFYLEEKLFPRENSAVSLLFIYLSSVMGNALQSWKCL